MTLDPDARRIAGPRAAAHRQRRRRADAAGQPLAVPERARRSGRARSTTSASTGCTRADSRRARIEIANLRVDGAPAPVTLHDVAVRRAAARSRRRRCPRRSRRAAPSRSTSTSTRASPAATARSDATALRCRLMGGFYPMPARDHAGRAGRCARRPQAPMIARAGRTRVSLRLPPGLALVLDGQPIVERRRRRAVTGRRRPVRRPS